MDTGGPEGSGARGKPLVSVIIPTHNRAHCLPRALDSVYAQEGLGEDFDLEVIVERTDGQIQHYWREGGSWQEGPVIGPSV